MNNYNLGNGGVNVVKNPAQLADNEITKGQNAEYHPDEGVGGQGAITKRGGLAKLFISGLGGAILGMAGVGLDAIPQAEVWDPESQSGISNPDGDTINYVGGADGAEVLKAHSITAYIEFIIKAMTTLDAGHQPTVKLVMDTWPEPSVSTGEVLHFKLRTTNSNLAVWMADPDFNSALVQISFRIGFVTYDFYVDDNTGSGTGVASTTLADIAASPNTWFDISIPVPQTWADDWRANDVYTSGTFPVWISVYNQTPTTGTSPALTFQIADLYVETP